MYLSRFMSDRRQMFTGLWPYTVPAEASAVLFFAFRFAFYSAITFATHYALTCYHIFTGPAARGRHMKI